MHSKLEKFSMEIGDALINKGWHLALAESCTGGLISSIITDISGSSNYFENGMVVYSNQSKIRCLDVSEESLVKYGAVSKKVAEEMAVGLLKRSRVDIALSVTGIAGPGGGSKQKPVGTVWSAIATPVLLKTRLYNFSGERKKIKHDSAIGCLEFLIEIINSD